MQARCRLLSVFSSLEDENTRWPDGFRHPSAAVTAKLHSWTHHPEIPPTVRGWSSTRSLFAHTLPPPCSGLVGSALALQSARLIHEVITLYLGRSGFDLHLKVVCTLEFYRWGENTVKVVFWMSCVWSQTCSYAQARDQNTTHSSVLINSDAWDINQWVMYKYYFLSSMIPCLWCHSIVHRVVRLQCQRAAADDTV